MSTRYSPEGHLLREILGRLDTLIGISRSLHGRLQEPDPPGTPAETRNHMAYNKAEVTAVGNAVYDLLKGLSDGIGNQEIANLMTVLTAAVAASDEFKEDFDAAGLHVLARMADRFGDDRVNPAV